MIGPDGRGVIAASADVDAATRTRSMLVAAGVPAAVPADAGLRAMPRWDAVDAFEKPEAGQARFWATAARRPAVVEDGDGLLVALPDGAVEELAADAAAERLAELVEVRPPVRVAVFGGAWIEEQEIEYHEAETFGRLCAEAGIEVVNGGYAGIMGAASKGAASANGTVVGVTIAPFTERVAVNPWLTHEVEAADLYARLPLICDADAWVAFPGGVGTLSEVALCWSLVQTESVTPRPLVIVGERWDAALTKFRELLYAEEVHFELVRPAASAADAFELVRVG